MQEEALEDVEEVLDNVLLLAAERSRLSIVTTSSMFMIKVIKGSLL